jgi:tripartite-type tricarboxylate transporter receptor subunit TctC
VRNVTARIALSALCVLAAAQVPPAWAQYPAKPIRLIVPAAPGGGTDIVTRSVTPAFQEILGQNVLIENRGGAGGIIGTEVVAKAAPDGYTLLMVYVSHATNPTLNRTLPYDTLRDFAPVTLMAHEPTVLVTHPSVPTSTLKEFIAWAKEGAAKGKLSYATDPGSAGFLAGELFKQKTDLKAIEYIPYKGSGPAAADVVAGHVPYMWSVISIATPFVKQGRMKALAIAAEHRAPGLPDVPTTAEGGLPDFAVSGWYVLVAPAKTPQPIIDRLNDAAQKALKNEAVLSRLAASGTQPIGAGPDQAAAHIRAEMVRWDRVLKAAGVQPAN